MDKNTQLTVDSSERVAYDLMRDIKYIEQDQSDITIDRSYYLNLYHQCRLVVVSGVKPKDE